MATQASHTHGAAAEARPPIRRVFSHPRILLGCLALSVLVIYLIGRYAPEPVAALLVDPERSTYPFTVQNVMWIAFAIGLGEHCDLRIGCPGGSRPAPGHQGDGQQRAGDCRR